MKKPFLDSAASRHPLKPKRIILKITNKTGEIEKITLNCSKDVDDFDNSHGSSWFRGLLLGKGGFGSVFLAHVRIDFFVDAVSRQLHRGALIAVKSSFLEDSSSLQFEKKVFDDLKVCPNVVRCYGDEITKSSASGKQIYNLLLEYCSGGSLRDRIGNFKPNRCLPELEVRRYTRDIVCGIASIHGSGYIHCDIKPENILLRPGVDCYGNTCLVAKIADFGLTIKITNVVTIDDDDIRGTESYMAPEMLKDSYIDWPVDIWALGCVVFEMLTGKRAWNSKTLDRDLLNYIGYSGNEMSKIQSGLSPLAIDFLRRCLIRNPYKRLSARLLLDHPFICDFDDRFESNIIH